MQEGAPQQPLSPPQPPIPQMQNMQISGGPMPGARVSRDAATCYKSKLVSK